MESFSMLRLRVEPGGSRKHDVHVLGGLAEVRTALLGDLHDECGLSLLLMYGEEVELAGYEDGVRAWAVDLLPHVGVRLPGLPEFRVDRDGLRRDLLDPRDLGAADGERWDEQDWETWAEELDDRLFGAAAEDVGAEVRVDWEGLRVPPLRGAPLRPGRRVMLRGGDPTASLPGWLDYGRNDLEG